ncbi:MAG: hypothetical protein COA78_13170 [Blastopirellula sp.]|nr:MAG: hypothetical protein COA78_13170 [Blastopirellula sp.]
MPLAFCQCGVANQLHSTAFILKGNCSTGVKNLHDLRSNRSTHWQDASVTRLLKKILLSLCLRALVVHLFALQKSAGEQPTYQIIGSARGNFKKL